MDNQDQRIMSTLQSRNFDALSVADWKTVMLDIIQETEDIDAAFDKRKSQKINPRDPMHIVTILNLYSRDDDPLVESALFFPGILSLFAKKNFAQAITELVAEYYEIWRSSGNELVLRKVLDFARMFEHSLDPIFAEKLVLDEKLDQTLRVSAGNHLLGDDFASQPSSDFWKKIEEQVAAYPLLASLIAYHYLKDRNEYEIFRLLKKFKPVSKEETFGLELVCREAYGRIINVYSHGKERFDTLFVELPQWAREFLEKNVIPFPIF